MSDWRNNPNLTECFANCVAMFRGMPPSRPQSRADLLKARRVALGISATQLGREAGYSEGSARSLVSDMECGRKWCHRIIDTLDRLEAERQLHEAAE